MDRKVTTSNDGHRNELRRVRWENLQQQTKELLALPELVPRPSPVAGKLKVIPAKKSLSTNAEYNAFSERFATISRDASRMLPDYEGDSGMDRLRSGNVTITSDSPNTAKVGRLSPLPGVPAARSPSPWKSRSGEVEPLLPASRSPLPTPAIPPMVNIKPAAVHIPARLPPGLVGTDPVMYFLDLKRQQSDDDAPKVIYLNRVCFAART